jgi:AraC-like DNA-binding protein
MQLYKQPYPLHVARATTNIKLYIDDNPFCRKSTDELAAHAGLNRNVLQQAFKFIYFKTIKEYQFEKRMKAACELLLEGQLIKKEISRKCGYENANNFSNAFKKLYKMSPSEYQKHHWNNNDAVSIENNAERIDQ